MVGRLFWNLGNVILLGAICVAALVHTRGGSLSSYFSNISFVVGVALSTGLVVGVGVFTLLPRGRRWCAESVTRLEAAHHRYGMRLVVPVLLILIIGLTALWTLPADFRYVSALILFNITMLSAVWVSVPSTGQMPNPRRYERLLWVLLVVLLTTALVSAHTVPERQIFDDEATWTDIARNLLVSGQAYARVIGHEPVVINPGYGWWVAPYAGWLSVFGLSLATGRLFMWVIYALVVAAIGGLGGYLYGRMVGLVAATLTGGSLFLLTFRVIRPEIGLAAVGPLLLLCYLRSQKRPIYAFAGGWLAFGALEIHGSGIALVGGFALMFVLDGLRALRQRRNPLDRRVLVLVAGLALGAVGYWALHVLIQTGLAGYTSALGEGVGFLSSLPSPAVILARLNEIWIRSPFELFLLALGVAGMAMRFEYADRVLLRYYALVAVCYLLLVPDVTTPGRYMVLYMPFIAVSGAVLITRGFRRSVLAPGRPAVTVLAVAALCTPVMSMMVPAASWGNPLPPVEPSLTDQRVRAWSTPDEVVVGDIQSYWSLLDYEHFYADLSEYQTLLGYPSAAQMWSTLKPDLVYHVYHLNGAIQIPPVLRQYLADEQYMLVERVDDEGRMVEFYRRPTFVGE